jgi:ribosomal protein S18 acetylase RimI-like enzyme
MDNKPLSSLLETSTATPTVSEATSQNYQTLSDLRQNIDGVKPIKAQKEANKYTSQSEGKKAFIAFIRNVPVGYIQTAKKESLPEKSTLIDDIDDYTHLARIGVVQNARRKGVAKTLILEAEKWALKQGKKGVWLDYLKDNQHAAKFYSKAGYENVQEFTDKKGRARIIAIKKF